MTDISDQVIEFDQDGDGVGDFIIRSGKLGEVARIRAADGSGSGWAAVLGGSLPASTITLTNPATTGLTIVPASGQTSDVLVINAGSQAVGAGTSLDLIHLTSHNTGPATSNLYGLRVDTNSDTVDTGAGIALVNTGNADSVYIAATGSAGATTPTGIGIDVNKATATTENSSTYAGYGIQLFDFSTTNIGGPAVGPTGIFLLKKNNPDTDHVMLYIRANRKAIRLTIPDTSSGSYSASQPIFAVTNNAGANLFSIQADGQVLMPNASSIFFTMASGNQGYVQGNGSNQLELRGGTGGVRFLDSSGVSTRFAMTDAGAFTFSGAVAVSAADLTLSNAKSVVFTRSAAGNTSYIQMNSSDQVEVRGGGGATGGLRLLNNAGTNTNLQVSDLGKVSENYLETLAGASTDTQIHALSPTLNGAFTVTRLNYLTLTQPAGAATITDAAVLRFDAAIGTHKAVDAGTTKTTPGTVTAWVKININGTLHFIPAYSSKTT